MAIGVVVLFYVVGLSHHPHRIELASEAVGVCLVNMAVAAWVVYRKGKRRVSEAVKAAANRQA
jgi:hypothetical protein